MEAVNSTSQIGTDKLYSECAADDSKESDLQKVGRLIFSCIDALPNIPEHLYWSFIEDRFLPYDYLMWEYAPSTQILRVPPTCETSNIYSILKCDDGYDFEDFNVCVEEREYGPWMCPYEFQTIKLSIKRDIVLQKDHFSRIIVNEQSVVFPYGLSDDVLLDVMPVLRPGEVNILPKKGPQYTPKGPRSRARYERFRRYIRSIYQKQCDGICDRIYSRCNFSCPVVEIEYKSGSSVLSDLLKITDQTAPFALLIYDLYKSGSTSDRVISIVRFVRDLKKTYPSYCEYIQNCVTDNITDIVVSLNNLCFTNSVPVNTTSFDSQFVSSALNLTMSSYGAFIYLGTFCMSLLHSLHSGYTPDLCGVSKYAMSCASEASQFTTTFVMLQAAIDKVVNYIRQLYVGETDRSIYKRCQKLSMDILTANAPQSFSDFSEISTFGCMVDEYQKLYKMVINSKPSLSKNPFSFDSSSIHITSAIENKHISVMDRINEFNSIMTSARLREQPYCMSIFGGSSIGKSSCCAHIHNYLSTICGLPTDPKFVYSFAPGHKFMDGYAPWKTVTVLDDIGAVRKDCLPEGDPMVIEIIRMINNAPFMTNQAEIAAKNCTPFQSPIVIATTNVKDLNAKAYMSFEATILRRILRHITVKPHGIFNDNGVLNKVEASRWSNDPANKGSFPPFWSFTVEEYVIDNTDLTRISGNFRVLSYFHPKLGTVLLRDVDHIQLLAFLQQDIITHRASQKSAVAPITFDMCSGCNVPRNACHCNAPVGIVTTSSYVYDTITCVGYMVLGIVIFLSSIFVLYPQLYRLVRTLIRVRHFVNRLRARWHFFRVELWSNALMLRTHAYRTMYQLIRRQRYVDGRVLVAASSVTAIVGTLLLIKMFFKREEEVLTRGISHSHTLGKATRIDPITNTIAWGENMSSPPFDATNSFKPPNAKTFRSEGGHMNFRRKLETSQGRIYIKHMGPLSSGYECGNCVSIGRGAILANCHTFSKFPRNAVVQISIVFSPYIDEMGRNVPFSFLNPQRPGCGYNASLDLSKVCFDDNSDQCLFFINTRFCGIYDHIALDMSFSNSDPSFVTRGDNGVCVFTDVLKSEIRSNFEAHAQGSMVFPRAMLCELPVATRDGDSGSILYIHTGNRKKGVYGDVVVVGLLVGNIRSDMRTALFSCFDKSKIDSMIATCNALMSTDKSLSTRYVDVVLQSRLIKDNHFPISDPDVKPTHYKSCWSNMCEPDHPCVEIYGGLANFISPSKTNYRLTDFSHVLTSISHHSVLGDLTNNFLPTEVPKSSVNIVHHRAAATLLSHHGEGIPEDILNRAASMFLSDVIDSIPQSEGYDFLRPYSTMDAINGVPGNFPALNFNSGGGYGYAGSKSKYFDVHIAQEGDPYGYPVGVQYRTPKESLCRDIEQYESYLRDGVDPCAIFTSHMKDEVRSSDKVRDCKIRVMNGSPLPLTIVMRKYLIGIVLLCLRYKYECECAVGMNCESRQWTDFAMYLREYGDSTRFIDGDYVDFDKNQKIGVSTAASTCMYGFIRYASEMNGLWTSQDLVAALTLCVSICHPFIDFFGTLIRVSGTNPSGHSLTTQKNCFVNSIYMRCVFLVVKPRGCSLPYKSCIRQVNYGDDVVMAVSDRAPWFNHLTVRDTLAVWHIPYTKSDKSEITNDSLYTHFDELSFLKRKWVYDHEIDGYLAPIDPKSIVRGLHYYESGALSSNQHHANLLFQLSQTAFSYGRTKYDEVVKLFLQLKDLSLSYGNSDMHFLHFLTYDDFIVRYRQNSNIDVSGAILEG